MGYTKCKRCQGFGSRPDFKDLVKIRERAGLSRAEVSRDMKVSTTYVRYVETGQRTLSERVLKYYLEISPKTITVHPSWAADEAGLMWRVAHIVVGNYPECPEAQDTGYDWRLDPGNTWWASLDGDQLTVARPYGPPSPATMSFLAEELGIS